MCSYKNIISNSSKKVFGNDRSQMTKDDNDEVNGAIVVDC